MTIEQRDGFGHAGTPYTYTEELQKALENLKTGDSPGTAGIDLPLKSGLTVPALTPMAIEGTGRMVIGEAKNALGSPGVVAKGSITCSGNAGSAFTIHGATYSVPASVGNVNARAEALAKLVNEDRHGPCFATATGSSAVVTLYARFPGISGNGTVTPGTGTTSAGDLSNGSGEDVMVGILVQDTTTASDQIKSAGVYVAGVYNPDRLKWHASFNSEHIIRHAFFNTLPLTHIYLRKIRSLTV